MIALLLAFSLANHNPYHWTMTCARWQEVQMEVMADPHLDYRAKQQILRHFRTKVREKCDSIFI
jgi:hypothetical protein